MWRWSVIVAVCCVLAESEQKEIVGEVGEEPGRGGREQRSALLWLGVSNPLQKKVVKSHPLKVKVPPARKYFNPTKGVPLEQPVSFQRVPTSPYPFQDLYVGEELYLAPEFDPTPTVFWSTPVPFKTRPPWIPRGGFADVKPLRGSPVPLPSSLPHPNPNAITFPPLPKIRPTTISVNDLISQVEKLIMSAGTNRNASADFSRKFKHPGLSPKCTPTTSARRAGYPQVTTFLDRFITRFSQEIITTPGAGIEPSHALILT